MVGERARRALVIIPLTGKDLAQTHNQVRGIADFIAGGGICDLVEWRLDQLAPHQLGSCGIERHLAAIREAAGVPLLATYRTRSEGGDGDPERWQEATLAAVEGGADLVDVELPFALATDVLDQVRGASAAVVSKHFFNPDSPPTQLEAAVKSLREVTAGRANIIAKLAVMAATPAALGQFARQLKDTPLPVSLRTQGEGEMVEVPRNRWGYADGESTTRAAITRTLQGTTGTPADGTEIAEALAGGITIAMGEAGRESRIYPGRFRSCATFATLAGKASAPGQVEAAELTAQHRRQRCLRLPA